MADDTPTAEESLNAIRKTLQWLTLFAFAGLVILVLIALGVVDVAIEGLSVSG